MSVILFVSPRRRGTKAFPPYCVHVFVKDRLPDDDLGRLAVDGLGRLAVDDLGRLARTVCVASDAVYDGFSSSTHGSMLSAWEGAPVSMPPCMAAVTSSVSDSTADRRGVDDAA